MTLPPFQALVDHHAPDLFRYLTAAVGPADASDCFQETMLAALRAYPGLEDASNLRGWLFTIAHHKTIDLHRARARVVPVAAVPERGAEVPAAPDESLWAMVRDLPPMQRTAVVHRFVGDLPYAEIGRVLGCSEGAARQNVHTALSRLRGAWER